MAVTSLYDLHEQLRIAALNKRQLRKLEQTFQNLWSKLSEEESRADALQQKLISEFRDVERLENGNIIALFYSILGTREKQMEKERQEFLAARLSFEASMAEVQQIRHDLSQTQNLLE